MTHRSSAPAPRSAAATLVPIAWLALSATWATIVVVTGLAAWPLALWIAATISPVTVRERRR